MPLTPTTKTLSLQHPQNGKIYHIEMIEVKGGTFEMGSEEYGDEKPIHKVTVPTFYIGKYPVTQSHYEFVMGENPSDFKGLEHPVERVSWNDCQGFIEKLNREFGGLGFRLPSESEWEYAARGGRDWERRYKYAGSDKIEEVAWYNENSHRETKPVGWKKPNQLGIHDMSGNVWEWCKDDYHESYEKAPDDGSAWIDESRGTYRVLRGGSWLNDSDYCRVSYRIISTPSSRVDIDGLRLVLPQF